MPRVPLVSTWKAFTSIHCSPVHFFNEQLTGGLHMQGVLPGTGECRRIEHHILQSAQCGGVDRPAAIKDSAGL